MSIFRIFEQIVDTYNDIIEAVAVPHVQLRQNALKFGKVLKADDKKVAISHMGRIHFFRPDVVNKVGKKIG